LGDVREMKMQRVKERGREKRGGVESNEITEVMRTEEELTSSRWGAERVERRGTVEKNVGRRRKSEERSG
jgi:hypothetical protein